MKTGKTLTQLAQEIERQQMTKRDFIVPTQNARLDVDDNGGVEMALPTASGVVRLPVMDTAHQQIAERVGVPVKYYQRMAAEAPGLLVQNVNHWFREKPENRMVRTLDGYVRAFLSDRYRPLENADLAEAILPVLGQLDLELVSSEITDKRLYLKAVDKRITRDIPSGKRMGDGSHVFFDTVSPAIVVSNSEIGWGALSVETAVWTKGCTNLAIFEQKSLRKYHIGTRHDVGEKLFELLSDRTREQTDRALWMQVRDVTKAAFDQARFDASLAELKGMAEQRIEGDVVKVVELAAKKFTLTDGERGSVLRHLVEGGDLSRYGLFNAVTRAAEDAQDYDRATDFERLGGRVIDLPRSEWDEMAKAA